jgi:two-component system sensor histidine kinase BaeS
VVPVIAVFALLLGSADPVFGHYLAAPVGGLNVVAFPSHLLEVCAGAVAFAVLAARARRPVMLGAIEAEVVLPRSLRGGSWIATLASVDALFAAFVAVQFAYFFGGRTRVLTQEGLTFAAYARTGFSQLLLATALTGGVIAFAWIGGGRSGTASERRWFAALASGLVVMDLVVLVSAFRRLTLYEGAFGWTWPRLLGHAAVLAVGAMLLCALVAITARRVAWLPTAAVVVATLTLLGLSAVDPDAFIAQRNVDRYLAAGQLDVAEIRRLSVDASPVLLAALPQLHGCVRRQVAGILSDTDPRNQERGWASWNLGRERAADALANAGTGGSPTDLGGDCV